MKFKDKGKFYKPSKLQKGSKIVGAWYEAIYDPNELVFYQDFSHDQYCKIQGIVSSGQIIRCICLSVLILLILLTMHVWPVINLFVYFTNWTLIVTALSIYSSYQTVTDKDAIKCPSKLAKHHLLYTLSIILNSCTVIVYWTFIHSEMMQEFAG